MTKSMEIESVTGSKVYTGYPKMENKVFGFIQIDSETKQGMPRGKVGLEPMTLQYDAVR